MKDFEQLAREARGKADEREHSKVNDAAGRSDRSNASSAATFNPFADLKERMQSAKRR